MCHAMCSIKRIIFKKKNVPVKPLAICLFHLEKCHMEENAQSFLDKVRSYLHLDYKWLQIIELEWLSAVAGVHLLLIPLLIDSDILIKWLISPLDTHVKNESIYIWSIINEILNKSKTWGSIKNWSLKTGWPKSFWEKYLWF